jgi:hypothetical protein
MHKSQHRNEINILNEDSKIPPEDHNSPVAASKDIKVNSMSDK